MPCFIFVEPSGDGWVVRGDFRNSPLMFPTGGRAEQAARDLALGLAEAGDPVVLDIRLLDGGRAGRYLFPAHAAADAALGLRA
ncbi:hypothetical protein [Caulobacter hibisci]|uniref:DUF2188 domain-containing protein n=1 Tax=Caulobacter hibisci TaxID=2035993 RepID=A0ABS0SZ08_9CAUL|nr:hypothetical protein [Caulobacter hibisci]MBI1684865.1 hypothetical protein [Caulobacter hibisci]